MIEKSKKNEEEIKMIFKLAKPISILHQILTSPTCNYFRLRLLQKLERTLIIDEIKKLRAESGAEEFSRHINMLLRFKLVKKTIKDRKETYKRTELGEEALNAVKKLQRKLGKKDAKKIFDASLGKNSIRLFIKIYEQNKDFALNKDFLKKKKEIIYEPLEIGKISLFLQRSIEGLAAIDKLDLAKLLYYDEDGHVHFPSIKARSFFQYLKELLDILPKK